MKIRDGEFVSKVTTARCCIYCGATPTTGEHVVSESVLKVFHGADIQNIVHSELFKEPLHNYEWKVNDVCRECNNNRLSHLDTAGAELARYIQERGGAGGGAVPFSRDALHWLLKTHLNHIRVHGNKTTGRKHTVDAQLYRALKTNQDIPTGMYRLAVEGWMTLPEYWTRLGIGVLRYRSYAQESSTVSLGAATLVKPVRIAISNFRMKWFSTFLLLPSDGNYSEFNFRAHRAMEVWNRHWRTDLAPVAVQDAIRNGRLRIRCFRSEQEVLDAFLKSAYEGAGDSVTRESINRMVKTALAG